jgi:SAM-dependent methyltransferase
MKAEWSRYWARETSGACLPGASPAVQNALIGAWKQFFPTVSGRVSRQNGTIQLLDVASGGGSVLKILLESALDIVGIGIDAADVGPSAAALGVRGGIDAHALPFPAEAFDLVTSQFGLEYCERAAGAEAVRVLAPKGQLMLICHHHCSAAVRHNGRRLAAMRAMADAGLFAAAALVVSGRGESAAMAAAIATARAAHADQSVTTELPAALGH